MFDSVIHLKTTLQLKCRNSEGNKLKQWQNSRRKRLARKKDFNKLTGDGRHSEYNEVDVFRCGEWHTPAVCGGQWDQPLGPHLADPRGQINKVENRGTKLKVCPSPIPQTYSDSGFLVCAVSYIVSWIVSPPPSKFMSTWNLRIWLICKWGLCRYS